MVNHPLIRWSQQADAAASTTVSAARRPVMLSRGPLIFRHFRVIRLVLAWLGGA